MSHMKHKDREKLTELIAMFPPLNDAPGTAPFDAHVLARWMQSNECVGAAYFAALFVLGVAGHKVGEFDAVAALVTWPAECRLAFLSWASDPWTASTGR